MLQSDFCLWFVSAAEAPPLSRRPLRRLARPGLTMTLGLIGDNINFSLAGQPASKYWSNGGHSRQVSLLSPGPGGAKPGH